MNLMRSCREKEMKFIVRTLVRNLRIGAMMRTILPALAQAVALNSFSSDECKAENVKDKLQYISTAVIEAYNILPSLALDFHHQLYQWLLGYLLNQCLQKLQMELLKY